MPSEEVSIRIRAHGGRQAARDVSLVERALDGLGRSASATSRKMEGLVSRSAGRSLMSLRYQAYGAGLTIGGLGALAVKSGLQFNSSMEQNEVAFTQFLGSSQAAKKELTDLYNLAKVTPFEFADLTLATRKFLAFGFTVKESNGLLKTVADTASGLALDQGGIDRMVLAIGQIKSKGTLQAQDLRQLQELGAVDTTKLRQGLGLTAEEMANIGKQHVPATRALRVLKKQWDDTFGGMSAKQAKTFAGQVSTLRDNLNQTMGTLSMPLFNTLKRRVFPALNDTAQRVNDIFSNKHTTLEQKFNLSRTAISHRLGPLVDAFRDKVGQMRLGDKLSHAFEAAVPRLADAAGNAAPKVAGAFVRGWWNAGPYGKLFAAAVIAKKLGVFTLLGRIAALRFAGGWTSAGGGIAGGAAGGGKLGKAGKLGGLARAGRAIPVIGAGIAAADFGYNVLGPSLFPEKVRRPNRRASDDADAWAHREGWVPGKGWTRGRPHARGPRARGATINHTTIVKVRDREIGRATDRYHADERARNRSRNR